MTPVEIRYASCHETDQNLSCTAIMISYVATSHDIKITVLPVYLDGRSDPMEKQFVFGYYVRIENEGPEEVQLLRRHWIIKDQTGHTEEVEGEGVIGEQPVISSGAVHEYNSFSILKTFGGSMEGTYLMERPGGEQFRATIPQFHLMARAN